METVRVSLVFDVAVLVDEEGKGTPSRRQLLDGAEWLLLDYCRVRSTWTPVLVQVDHQIRLIHHQVDA
jgi:hypothetical protein